MENWKPIADYEGIYEVSDLGNVRSIVTRKNSYSGKVLKASLRSGYRRFNLTSLDGKSKRFTASRLVAEHFISNPENKPEVNHVDGKQKQNDAVTNLEWATESENTQHAHDTGLSPRGEKRHNAKLTAEDIPIIRALLRGGETATEIGRKFGVSNVTVHFIKHRKSWKWA